LLASFTPRATDGVEAAPTSLLEQLEVPGGELLLPPAGAPLRLAQFPPALVSVACKPVHFDIAHGLLSLPDLDARVAAAGRGKAR
jgi:hypothetical protein